MKCKSDMSAIYKVVKKVANHPGVYRSAVNLNPARASGKWAPSRRYRVGQETSARSGSMGLFCFNNYTNAVRFASDTEVILEVEGTGEPDAPTRMDSNYQHPFLIYVYPASNVPLGTICYPSVKVLSVRREEIA